MPQRALALLAVASTLCALPSVGLAGGWRCSTKGGAAWREVSTEHFRIATDLSPGKAEDLARELETMHVAVRGALFRSPPPMPGLVRVVAFRDEEDYREFAPERADAYYTLVDGEPTVVMHGGFGEYTRLILAHELAHHVLARVFVRQPRWFSEGVASYLETVGVSGPDTTPTVGGVPAHRHRQVYPYHGGIARVLQARGALPDSRAYGLAWALVHYLIQARGAEFAQLQGRLLRGEDPEAAWLAVFPQWNPADPAAMKALDKELGLHVSRGRFAYRTIQLVKDHAVSERPLAPADVHGLRLALWRQGAAEAVTALDDAEAAEAITEDPGHVRTLRYLASRRREEAPALAARALAAHPEDARAWLFSAATTPDAAEQEKAYRKAIELAPDLATALNDLAWLLVQQQREGEALPLARKAVGLEPWSPPVLDTYAAALEGLGQCVDALLVQKRAVDVLPERADDEDRAPYVKRLARLEASCGAGKQAP